MEKDEEGGVLLAAVSRTRWRPNTSEGTADKNAKEEDEAGIINRGCLC